MIGEAGSESGAEEAIVGSGEEEGGAESGIGDAIAMSAWAYVR